MNIHTKNKYAQGKKKLKKL